MSEGFIVTRPRVTPMLVMRSLAFTLWTYAMGLLMGLACLPLLFGSERDAVRAIRLWSRAVMWGLRHIVDVRIEVRGLEHRPDGAALIIPKHQCLFDILPPFVLLEGPSFVLKRELMRIPVFGWFAARGGMIVIDRAGGAKTLRTMIADGKRLLAQGRQIVIFPEGTRKEPGAPPDYKPGVAGLYREFETPCTPVATNAGLVWPAHGLLRYPGVIVYEFLPPIPAGLKRVEFMRRLETAIEEATARLLA